MGKRILVVDDEKSIVDILRLNLQRGIPFRRHMTALRRWKRLLPKIPKTAPTLYCLT